MGVSAKCRRAGGQRPVWEPWAMKPSIIAFAVVRHEDWTDDVALGVKVVAVVPTFDEAEAEAARLNRLNFDKNCTYFVSPTKWHPEGRDADE